MVLTSLPPYVWIPAALVLVPLAAVGLFFTAAVYEKPERLFPR